MPKKNITQPLYHILIFSVSYILKAQPTSFSPTTDDDLPPSAHGKKTIPCSLNIYCTYTLRQQHPEKLSQLAFIYICSKAFLYCYMEKRSRTQNACTFCLFAPKIVCPNREEMLCLKSYCPVKNSPIYPRSFYQYFSKVPALENYMICFDTLQMYH